MRAALQSFEKQVARVTEWAFVLAWPALYATALGFSSWSWRHRSLLATLAKNKLNVAQRLQMAGSAVAAAGVVLLVYLFAMAVTRLRHHAFLPLRVIGEVNRRGAAVLALPFVVALAAPGVESSDPIWTVLLAAFAASLVALTAYRWRSPIRSDEPREPAPPTRFSRVGSMAVSIGTLLGLLGLWAGYGFLLSRLAVGNHHALNTRTIDLGYYDNVFYNSSHGRPLGCTFVKGGTHASAHFDPILIVLSPFYLLYPRAEFLLVLQSVWLGMGVLPAYLLGKKTLSRASAGWTMALVYALYPALHGANLYEFHSLALIAPLVLWLFYFLEVKRWGFYAVTVLLLCLCREDLPLMLCFVGLYAILTGRPGIARAGLATIAFSIAYYALVRGVFMPSKDLLNSGSDKAYSYAYYFDELIPNKRGVVDVALSLLTNPMFILRLAFGDPHKVLYLLVLFVPLGCLPLFAKKARLTLVYGLLVCLLASRKPVFQVGFQYAAMIFPFAFAITPRAIGDVLEATRERGQGVDPAGVRRAILSFMLAVSAALSWKFGALVENTSFRGGFGKIARWPLDPKQREDYADLRSLVDRIEPGASVLVTNRVGAHVSNRRTVYLVYQRKVTNYVLIEENDLSKHRGWHDERVTKGELKLLERRGTFSLWQAVPVAPSVPAAAAPSAAASGAASAAASGAPGVPVVPDVSHGPSLEALDFTGEEPN